MLLAHKSRKIAVCGSSGTGKTTYWTRYVLYSKYRYKFVFDHEGEMAIRLARAFPGIRFSQCYQYEDLTRALEERSPLILFDPIVLYEGDLPGAFDFWCDWVFQVAKTPEFMTSPKLFALDELQGLSSTDIFTPYLARIVETGRRYGLDWASVQQAFNLVHNRVRAQITEAIVFQTVEKQALEFLWSLGFPEDVKELSQGEYILRNLKTGLEKRGKINLTQASNPT